MEIRPVLSKRHYPWLKVKLPHGENYFALKQLVRDKRLHTVCESASCPNIGECWNQKIATFMILGDVCTRSCGFCDVKTGSPPGLDHEEPIRVAEAVRTLGLNHAVITSVNRDELPDGGAAIWAATIRQVKALNPTCTVEALIPDFEGLIGSLALVLEAKPDILAHNTETVPRLYRTVRPQAKYPRSLELLHRAKKQGCRYQERSDGRLRGGVGGTPPGNAGSLRSALRYPDHRAVFAAVTTAPPSAAHLYSWGIPAPAPGRSGLRLQACRSRAISAEFVPCWSAKSQYWSFHCLAWVRANLDPGATLNVGVASSPIPSYLYPKSNQLCWLMFLMTWC